MAKRVNCWCRLSLKLKPSKSVVLLVRGGVGRFQLFLTYCVDNMALFAEVKIEAVFAFVSHSDDWHHLAAVALYIFPNLLSWLNNQFDSVGLMIMTSNLDFVEISRSCEIAVLAKTKMVTVSTNKTRADNWSHVAVYTFIVIMCR